MKLLLPAEPFDNLPFIVAEMCPQRGAFYELWHNNDAAWTKVRVSAQDCPRISKEFLDEELKELWQARFSEEYQLEFIDNQECAFPTTIIDRAFDPELAPLW